MPRYFFDVMINGEAEPDGEGVELADDDDARKEAVVAATEIAREHFEVDKRIDIQVRGASDAICTVTLRLMIENPSRGPGNVV